MDDVELPPLITRPLLGRKRTRSITSLDTPATSSDPALFSSDEQTPSVEDYVSHKRHKRQYPGTWWGERLRKTKTSATRRKIGKTLPTRNFDSGIFMGSDESSGPSSDGFLDEELFADLKKKEHKRNHTRAEGRPELWARRSADGTGNVEKVLKHPISNPQHDRVKKLLKICLEEEDEDFDLSTMGLTDLPDDILQLKTLTKPPHMVAGMSETGVSLESNLRLYLSNNSLTKVPKQIPQLSNLRTLSLRQNQLRVIPHSFRELVNLQSLNLSGNRLGYLPYELLELVRDHSLNEILISPNPFLDFHEAPKVAVRSEKRDMLDPVCCAFSGMTWTRDRHVSSLATASSESHRLKQVALRLPTETLVAPGYRDGTVQYLQETTFTSSRLTGTCSLTETILRQLARIGAPEDLAACMPTGTADNVIEALDALDDAQHDGRQCTWCHRSLVIPAKQWFEWWAVVQAHAGHIMGSRGPEPVPFLRMNCGTCGLDYASEKQWS